jgi:type I restriction enzyme S subunit
MAQEIVIEQPMGWIETSIGDISDYVQRGKGPKYTEKNKFPVVNQKAVRWFGIQEEHLKYVSEEQWDKWTEERFIREGDILWNSTGTGTIGRACYLDANEAAKAKVVDSHVTIVRSNNEICSKYLFYWIMHPVIQGDINGLFNGSTNQVELSKGKVLGTELPLSPLAEQKRIVEKLDSLLAQVEIIKQRLNNLPNIIKRFRQSVLTAAVSGKLTEQWRGENDVTNVKSSMSDILSTRSKIVTARTRIPEPHLKDEEYPIDASWEWVSLDALSSKIVDGVHHKPEYIEEGIPFMSVKDIKNGKMSFDYCKYISEKTHKEIHLRCNPEKGDLLITKSGTIGRTAIIDTDDVFDLFVSVALIKPASSDVNMKFIDIALRKWVNSIDVSSRVVGTAIKNLHLRDMRVLAIPFAPIEEQTEIVRLVEQHFALADTLEKNLKNAKQKVDNLTQSILAKAFRGKLVPQDPNDEPAEQLLARIKTARAEAELLEKAAKKVTSKTKRQKGVVS